MENNSTRKNDRKEERLTAIGLWRESGKSKKSFCDELGIKYHTFIGWTCPKKRKTNPKPGRSSAAFVPIQIKENTGSVFAEVTLQNGSGIIFHQPIGADFLRTLLR